MRYSKLLRDCRCHVSTTVRVVSTNGLSLSLCAPNDCIRQMTAGRRACSLALLVGSTFSTSRKVYNQSGCSNSCSPMPCSFRWPPYTPLRNKLSILWRTGRISRSIPVRVIVPSR